MSQPIWKISAVGWGVFFLMVGAGGAQEEWEGWQEPQESEYSNLGVEQQKLETEESETFDPSSVPGAQLNEGHIPSAGEEAALKTVILPEQTPLDSPELEKTWKEKGYGRPVGPEEKEKRPETIFGNRDIKEEIRKTREGSY